jgi:hypothetical protein
VEFLSFKINVHSMHPWSELHGGVGGCGAVGGHVQVHEGSACTSRGGGLDMDNDIFECCMCVCMKLALFFFSFLFFFFLVYPTSCECHKSLGKFDE